MDIELLKIVGANGVFAALFLYSWAENRKDAKERLKESNEREQALMQQIEDGKVREIKLNNQIQKGQAREDRLQKTLEKLVDKLNVLDLIKVDIDYIKNK